MVENVFFFAKFAVAFYSTDFLETCKNDGPHGDAPSVVFSEFLSWWNKGKIHKNSTANFAKKKHVFNHISPPERGGGSKRWWWGSFIMSNNIPSLNQEYTQKMFRGKPTPLRGAEGVQSLASRWKLSTNSIKSKYAKFQICIIECTVHSYFSSNQISPTI